MNNKIENFIFNNIVLYSKGWYQSYKGDMIDDLGYLISKIYDVDVHLLNEKEVSHYMLLALDNLCEEMNIQFGQNRCRWYSSHARFEEEVEHRMHLYEVSRERAIILTILSVFQGLSVDEIKLNCPHYGKKEHFRLGRIGEKYPISMTYKEMNSIAEKMFKK